MSKAFTDEETGDSAPLVPARAPLPDGMANYVTPRGLARLRAELTALAEERGAAEGLAADLERAHALAALAQRRAALEARIASAELVRPPADDQGAVRFGANVTVMLNGARRNYRIVGVDEADAATGRIAFTAPLARALLGRLAGDELSLRTPRGEEQVEILAIDHRPEALHEP